MDKLKTLLSLIAMLGALSFQHNRIFAHSPIRSVETNLKNDEAGGEQNNNNYTHIIATDQNNLPFWEKMQSNLKNWPAVAMGTLFGASLTLSAIIAPTAISSFSSPSTEMLEASKYTGDITAPVILFQDILTDLAADYIDNIDPAKLFKTGIQAMLQSLDPYTEFEDLNTAKTMQESVSGKYGGVGLVIGNVKPVAKPAFGISDTSPAGNSEKISSETRGSEQNKATLNSGVFVVEAFEGYAYDSNVRPGDRLVSIDGVDCSRMDVEQVRDLLRGVPDTQVRIEYTRDDFRTALQRSTNRVGELEVQEAVLKRQLVRLSDVRLATLLGPAEEGVGYINLAGFSAGAGRDFRNALLTLRQAAPADLKGLVLDLRGNPGGLLDMAVEVASYLVPEGSDIVSARGKTGPTVVYRSSAPNIRPDGMQLVVLVNKGSASASEIVAGAVQDLDAGIVLGSSSTYGKGLVQKIIPLPYDSALKYTIAKYFTPSGRCIQSVRYTGGRGVTNVAEREADAGVSDSPALPSGHPRIGSAYEPDSISLLGVEWVEELLSALHARWEGNAVYNTNARDGPFEATTSASPAVPGINTLNAADKDKSLVTPDNVNGGVTIPSSERAAYRTLYKHRIVKDGGGIEPDVLLAPLKVGPAEGVFYTQGVYPDFVKEYVRAHNVRHDIRSAALSEQITRNMDSAYASAAFLASTKQYYVSQPDTTRRTQGTNVMPSELYIAAGKTGIVASPLPFRDVNADRAGTGAGSVSSRTGERAPTASAVNIVPERYFWGRSRNIADRAQMFREFKQYVVQQLNTGGITLDAAFSAEEQKLQTALENAGFDSALAVQNTMMPKLRDALLSDMDLNRDSIVDGLERVILNSELPDRLVLYHGALRDPQISAATQILRGQKTLPYRPALKDSKITAKIANKLGAMSKQKNSADISGVSYQQILGGTSS